MATKEELRRQLLAARRQLSSDEAYSLSNLICQRLQPVLVAMHVHSLHYFEPIAASREVDITPVVRYIQTNDRLVVLAVSRRHGNSWVDERPDGTTIPDNEHYNCVIVPMLGFDTSLHRIGYGGGHYDRFLRAQSESIKVGVCFERSKVVFDASVHDVPMDMIVTEAAVYRQVLTP